MENLLQPVVQCYPKLCVEKQTKPSYVEIYQKTNNDIAIVYFKAKQNLSKQCNDKSKKAESDDFELTGSPLKLDLSLHTVLDETYVSEEPQMWKRQEALHAPIGSDQAREILNLYNKGLWKVSKEDCLPMWVLCDSSSEDKALLIHTESNQEQFARGIVTYEGTTVLDEFDVEAAVKQFANDGNTSEEMVNMTVECRLPISGVSYEGCTVEEQLNAPHGNLTELHCEWTSKSLLIPFISCKVHFVQEVTIGHLGSPCNAIWRSVLSLHNINQLLVDMTAAGFNSVNLEISTIRYITPGMKRSECGARLDALLSEAETYTYTQWPAGGCVCVPDDCSSLRACLTEMDRGGSSNDFTYRLWDILRDCETAEELITLLLQALKFVSSGKIRPFIDVHNKTYLSKLVLKLSRGHSQAAKVLRNLRATPTQALSLVAQVAVEKTMWEYTRIMSLLEHSFFIAGVWSADIRSHESMDQINQTIQDMTMGGELSLNPFESPAPEHSIRLDSESFCVDDNELTVHDFASLKKHGLVADKKDVNEVPLIADEIDISQWKHLLAKFAQIHVVLEHLYHAEAGVRADFAQLKPLAARLLEHYVCDKSPVRTAGQLASDAVQRVRLPLANSVVQDQLKKPASWYRMELSHKKSNASEDAGTDSSAVYLFSQQPVFPPTVWQNIEPPAEDVAEVTTIEELKYHCTKYTYLCNKVKRTIDLS